MKNAIKLTHKELVDLIVESIVEIGEQDRITSPEQFREVIKNLEKLYGPKEDNSKSEEVTEQRIGYDVFFDAEMKRKYGSSSSSSVSSSDSWYHYVIDGLSFLSYLLCGFTAGVGCVVSVVADICNALLYIYTKDDYYSAGMQLAFAVVPGGEALKYAAKPLKVPLNIIFKTAWNGSKNITRTIAKEVSNLTPSQLKVARKYFPKSLAKELSSGYNTALATAKGWYGTVPGLKSMMAGAGFLVRALVLFIEMCWYDPQLPATLIEFLAGKNSFSDWLKDQPKFGLNIWNKILENNGNVKGAITTTPYDCTGKVYTWDGDGEMSIEFAWKQDYPTEDFTEDNVWKEWQKGWRPDGYQNEYVIIYELIQDVAPQLITKYPEYLKNCKVFTRLFTSKEQKDVETLYKIYDEAGLVNKKFQENRF